MDRFSSTLTGGELTSLLSTILSALQSLLPSSPRESQLPDLPLLNKSAIKMRFVIVLVLIALTQVNQLVQSYPNRNLSLKTAQNF